MDSPKAPLTAEEIADTYTPPKHGWTCFHCGMTFTHENPARNHFGAKPDAIPGCLLRMQEGEHSMLRRIRYFECEMEKLSAENTALRGDIARKDEALLRQRAERNVERTRGSNDAPGFDACVIAEVENLRRAASALAEREE